LGLKFLAALGATLLPLAAGAEEPPLVPAHEGYAFTQPSLLSAQVAFGIAHAVGLLTARCESLPELTDAVRAAHIEWSQQQAATLDAIVGDLARHYFGDRAAEARWPHIVGALHLQSRLDIGGDKLAAACATLPEALRQPRYDLAAMLRSAAAAAASNGAQP
jgi:hypothetical protein